MTIRKYVEEMGLRLVRECLGETCSCAIPDVVLAGGLAVRVQATGATARDAEATLAQLISGKTLRDTVRETGLYWVPQLVVPQ